MKCMKKAHFLRTHESHCNTGETRILSQSLQLQHQLTKLKHWDLRLCSTHWQVTHTLRQFLVTSYCILFITPSFLSLHFNVSSDFSSSPITVTVPANTKIFNIPSFFSMSYWDHIKVIFVSVSPLEPQLKALHPTHTMHNCSVGLGNCLVKVWMTITRNEQM